MRWLGTMIHGGLLVVALLLAYLSWRGDEAPAAIKVEEVEIWTSSADRAAALEYRQGETKVRLWAEGEELPWLEVTEPVKKPPQKTPPRPAPAAQTPPGAETKEAPGSETKEPRDGVPAVQVVDPAAAGEAADAAPLPPQVTRFRGNKKAREALKRFRAPGASRSLGQPAETKLAALGLAPAEAVIEVDLDGATRRLEVGKTTFGNPGRYVRLPDSGEVFVTKSDISSDLRWAKSRLKESDPFGETLRDAARVRIEAGGLSRELTRLAEEDDAAAAEPAKTPKPKPKAQSVRWADPQRPEEEDGEATNWMSKLLRLRARKYLDARPAGAETPVLSVTFGDATAAPGRVLLYKVGDDEQETYVVQSQYLDSWLEVSAKLGEELTKDVGGLFISK